MKQHKGTDWNGLTNDDVDVELQVRQMRVHRAMMDSDTAHIDNEVEISAMEEGLTTDP